MIPIPLHSYILLHRLGRECAQLIPTITRGLFSKAFWDYFSKIVHSLTWIPSFLLTVRVLNKCWQTWPSDSVPPLINLAKRNLYYHHGFSFHTRMFPSLVLPLVNTKSVCFTKQTRQNCICWGNLIHVVAVSWYLWVLLYWLWNSNQDIYTKFCLVFLLICFMILSSL